MKNLRFTKKQTIITAISAIVLIVAITATLILKNNNNVEPVQIGKAEITESKVELKESVKEDTKIEEVEKKTGISKETIAKALGENTVKEEVKNLTVPKASTIKVISENGNIKLHKTKIKKHQLT